MLSVPDVDRGGEERIDCRLAEIHRGTVVECDRGVGAMTHNAHVLAARREIDAAGLDRLAVDGLMRRLAARARRCPARLVGEGRRHVLGDWHRITVDHK